MKYKSALILFLLVGLSGAVMAQSGDMSSDEIERIAHSVVMITNVQGGEELYVGSGTLVSSTGLIYTNRHVVEDAEDLYIYLLEDMNEQPIFSYRARPLAVFSEMDFAVLQIDRNANGSIVIPTALDLPFLTPVHNEIDRGTRIYIFGYPTIGNGYLVLTDGLISSAINDTIGEERMVAWYQTNAEIAPGNSGGLAVTAYGELVGIPTSVQSEDRTAGRLGGILPFRAVMALVEAGGATSIDTAPSTNNTNPDAQGGAELEITNIEANVERNGTNGTLIHLRAVVRGYKDQEVLAAVYFFDGDGNLVAADESATSEYVDANGWLRSRLSLTPGFDATEWDDITFWVPYGAFPHGLSGDVFFYAEADINDGEGWIAPSERSELVLVYDDNSTTTSTTSQGDTFTEVTNIEHNVEQSGANGMTVHVHAIVRGYKDQTVAASVYFYDTEGGLVPASDAADESYIDANGWLRSRLELEPGFDATEWDDMTFWIPYSAFPAGTGDVTYFAEADVYDGEEWIAPSEHYELVLSYGSSSTTNNNTSTGGGVTATCSDFTITNGVQIIVRQMRPNFTYTATVVGIDGFDPVMIIGNPDDPSNNICNDDADDAGKYQVDLPSTGLVAASSRSSQLFFTHTNANMTDISIVIGDYNGNAGEFVLVLEGMAVTPADGVGDPFTVMANSSVVGATAPLSVYMVGLESQLDPMFHLYDGDNQVWADTDGVAINCDDAGNSSICWGESVDLSGSQIRRGSSGTVTADASDAMLALPIQSIAPQPMTFVMSSYDGSSTGLYAIVFHMGLS